MGAMSLLGKIGSLQPHCLGRSRWLAVQFLQILVRPVSRKEGLGHR